MDYNPIKYTPSLSDLIQVETGIVYVRMCLWMKKTELVYGWLCREDWPLSGQRKIR